MEELKWKKIKQKRKASRAGLKFIAIAELIVIVILGGTLIWQGLLKDKLTGGDAVETLAQSGEPQVRTRAVIEKEESFYQLDGVYPVFLHVGELFCRLLDFLLTQCLLDFPVGTFLLTYQLLSLIPIQ